MLSNHLLLTIKDGNLRAPNPLVCHEPFVWAAVYARLYLLKLVLMQFRGRMAFKVKSWDWESAFVFRSRDKMKSATAMLLTDPVLSGVVLGRSTGQGGFEGSFLWGGWRRLFEMMVGELKAKGECGFGARDDNGMTPLVLASVLGDGKSVRALLDAGAEPVVEVHGKTAVEWSRYMGHEDVTEVLTSWLVNKGLGVPVPVVGELEIDPEFVKRKDYFSIYNKYQRWMGEDTVRMRIHLTPRVVGAGPGGRP